MRDQTAAYDFLFAGDHETVIYGALKRLHLSPSHPDYQDYLQEGRLLFVTLYQQATTDPQTQPHQFLAYAFKHLRWRLGDQLRRERAQADHFTTEDHAPILAAALADDDPGNLVALRDFRQYLVRIVGGTGSCGEWHYLVDTLVDHLSASEIAQRHGVSRQTVYRWRQRLMDRVLDQVTQ